MYPNHSKKGTRGFTEIPVVATGHLKGSGRPHREGQFPLHWRCNLTALSQCYNVYFCAYADSIYVYEPQFPSQSLGEADFVLKLPRSNPPRPGYINARIPHGVNHLIVSDLGTEEVLVIACDDGDVLAYHIRLIHDMVKRNRQQDVKTRNPKSAADLRPFFHVNVGMSAWGLAVHKGARLVAVSSNTHDISIYAWALHDDPPRALVVPEE